MRIGQTDMWSAILSARLSDDRIFYTVFVVLVSAFFLCAVIGRMPVLLVMLPWGSVLLSGRPHFPDGGG